ncbi:hypothetical protein O181_026815 [Austropuccinia psidii MF-1]|uniref:Uncharacterized protein n=1 Tax=Austropuccinia psidii MF-1 TaxID=1389203 RepID=A0A9Q3CQ49_9BASI|nr:hypothetical protein [Austropuccinia psidii MF-1]
MEAPGQILRQLSAIDFTSHRTCLCTGTALQMRLQHCPPISALTTSYPSAPPPHLLLGLQSLRSCGAFMSCLRCPPHTGSILKASYDPYAPEAPSR